jgi:saccharopine dehydrogenase-like NADP-dependent oxidoreductase
MEAQNNSKIAVIGGYGSVGSLLCGLLSQEFPGSIVVAGPEIGKAEALAVALGNGAAALEIDAFNPDSYGKLFDRERNVKAVISCVELPAANTLAQDVLRSGTHFTELSATYTSHQRLMRLDPVAKRHGATAVVGVGLMPGLSNVMAFDAAAYLDKVKTVTINIMLGLGETHGADAVRWTLRNIGTAYDIAYHDTTKRVRSFTDPHKTTLLGERKPRSFYRFNFSDQHMLNHAIPSAHVDSRMAFDSRFVTGLLGSAGRLGLLSVVNERAAPAFKKLVDLFHMGTLAYALQVEAEGVKGGRPAKNIMLAKGEIEARVTATVAAYVGKLLYDGTLPAGVHPIEQVVQANDLYAYVEQHGTKISRKLMR